jgi:ferredoxin-NADP reductase
VVRRAFEDDARSQCSFYLQPVDGAPLPVFLPGQFLTFAVPAREGATPSTLTRCYSLSDRPDPAAYRITIKRAMPPPGRPELPPGASSSHFHDRVHEGDVLRVKAPAGRFFIDTDASVPAVLIAGGIGITPMMSMLRWCVSEQPQRAVHLFYGVRNSADHAFKGVLESLARTHPTFQLHMVYSDPQPGDALERDHQHTGRIDLDLIRRCLPHGQHQFYVCGPPPMMQSLVPALREWGVREQDIHFEAFGPATVRPAGPVSNEPPPATTTTLDVHLRRSGRTLVWDGQDANLLDFAERHLVAVESGCRSGSCGSCETRLVSGSVRYAERPDHEVAPGHCLLCVATPQTALELEI